jgi:exonuclease VII large subunit
MSYQDIDKEIAHLEAVFHALSPRDRFPLSYWQRRLHALNRSSMVPAQRQRVAHLEAKLGARLEQLADATGLACATSPGR